MPIKFRLEGNSEDLSFLARAFPPSSDPHVGIDSEGYYLISDPDTFRLIEDPDSLIVDTDDSKALFSKAQSLLLAVNGTARLIRPDFRPVGLRGDYTNADGRLINYLGEPVVPWQPETVDQDERYLPERYLQTASARTVLGGKQVLAILGTPKPALDWSDLDKIYEIIGDHVTRGQHYKDKDIFEVLESGDDVAVGPQERRQALTDTGWVIEQNLDAFTSRRMPIEAAQRVITNLVMDWLDSL